MRLRWTTGVACALLMGVILGLPGARSHAEETLRVREGAHRLLERERPVQRIAIGSSEIAEVEAVSDRQILVLGRSAGRTSLILWHAEGADEITLEVEAAAAPHARVAGERELQIGPAGELRGRARSLPGLAAARELQRARGDGVDASELGFDTQVQIDIKVIEVSRQAIEQLGFQLMRNTRGSAHALAPPGVLAGIAGEGASVRDAFEGFVFGSPSGFLPLPNAFQLVTASSGSGFVGVLSVLEANGFAHTLAEPSLVAASGRTASFLAGGEFPIPVAQGGTNDGATISIEYREFGVRVGLRPFVLSRDHIVLEVAPEVSDLDFSAGIAVAGVAVPALATRRAETTIELGDGESFVIGGLISRTTVQNVERIPALAELPILGAFFRRTRSQDQERELMMIVSPRIVQPLRPGVFERSAAADASVHDPSHAETGFAP